MDFKISIFILFNVLILLSAESLASQKTDKEPVTDTEKKNTANTTLTLDIENNDHWTQGIHDTVSNSVYQSASWFDSFFTEEGAIQESPTTSAKIRLGWIPKARDLGEIETRFRIRVKLPHFKNKMSLILSDEDDVKQSQLPLEGINTRPQTNDDSFAAAIRYVQKKNNDRLTDYRVGISGGDIFTKARHKRRFDLSDSQNFKVEPSLYYYLDDGLGSRLLLEYNLQHNETSQYRVNYSIRGSEAFSGIRWKHGFYELKQLDQHSASIIGIQVEGERNGDRGFIIDNYTLSYRYRFNAIRDWIFFELEPFLEWPEDENYTTTPGIALRIEGFFNKK
jgi:hypothetical protein